MKKLAKLRIPSEVIFGSGCAETVGEQARKLGAKRALVISDQGIQKAGLVDQIESWLDKTGISSTSYVDVEAEPSTDSVSPCLDYARQAECDVVIGLGGGSVMDTAKAIAMLLKNEGAVEGYLGNDLVKRRGVPTILMPTTAGTGSEITPNALFYVPSRRAKEAVISPLIVTPVAMVDPALTLSVPPSVTAATGMDALCHAVESYTGLNATPLSEPFALEAIRLISANLREAVINGQSLRAREGMALGSLCAAISLANSGTNAVHALAYPLQGLKRITHGIANSLLLPYVMEFNLLGNLEKFAKVTEMMGQPIGHLSLRDAAAESARACRQLSQDVGIPQHMSDIGISAEQIGELVDGALKVTRLLKNNPRPMGAKDIERIFERAL
jgi:alcohol dehydrogenase class IV